MRIPSKIFLEVSVTNNELINVLTQLGFQEQIGSEHLRFVNDKYNSIVVLPNRPLDESVQKIYLSNYSYQLYMQGLIKDEEVLVKKVLQNRAKSKNVAKATS